MQIFPSPFISPDPIMPPCFRVGQLTPSDGPSRPLPLSNPSNPQSLQA